MARILGEDAEPIVQSDVSSIALKVYDQENAIAAITEVTPVVSSVIFNSLQTDARWTSDATGYNFRYHALPATVPNGGKIYRMEFVLTMADTSKIPIVFEVPTVPLFSS